jgi:hypothetical protein
MGRKNGDDNSRTDTLSLNMRFYFEEEKEANNTETLSLLGQFDTNIQEQQS